MQTQLYFIHHHLKKITNSKTAPDNQYVRAGVALCNCTHGTSCASQNRALFYNIGPHRISAIIKTKVNRSKVSVYNAQSPYNPLNG